jgi:type IV secretory pathway VirJ component
MRSAHRWALAALILAWSALSPAPQTASADDDVPKRVASNTRMGELRLYVPAAAPRAFVFLYSDASGWDDQDDATARELLDRGAYVAGVDLTAYLQGLRASPDGCHYLISEVEALSKELQHQLGAATYRSPILAGYGAGGTLAYAALAQSPAATVASAVAFDPAPKLRTHVPLCEGAPARPIVGGGFSYGPKKELPGKLRIAARKDDPATDFLVSRIPKAMLVTIDPTAPRVADMASLVLTERPGDEPAVPEDLSDLPLIELPAARPPKFLAVFLSGDGGWRDIDKQVAEQLASGDVAVIGIDTLRYFWTHKDPARIAGDVERILWKYLPLWHIDRVALIGYSFGADVLPATVNRLSPEARAKIVQVSMLAIGTRTRFEVHVTEWLGAEEDGPEEGEPIAPEVAKLDPAMLQCFTGEDDAESLCRTEAFAKAEHVDTSGGHHFDGDYPKLAEKIREGLERRSGGVRS